MRKFYQIDQGRIRPMREAEVARDGSQGTSWAPLGARLPYLTKGSRGVAVSKGPQRLEDEDVFNQL